MEPNSENLPVMKRVIASAIVISSDGKVLMGRKDPQGGGVYADAWHIPGGGVGSGESLEDAMRRELTQEVPGLELTAAKIEQLGNVGRGETTKVVDGQKYWCEMEFNRFKVVVPKDAESLSREITPGDDLVELRWFDRAELAGAQQIPGGKEFFQEIGLI